MASFKVQIEDMIGSVGDDQFLADSINAVSKEIINAMPEDKLWAVSEESSESSSNGLATEDSKVLGVFRENGTNDEFVSCKEVPMYYERKIQDSSSLFYPSSVEPVFLLKGGKVYVYPAPSASDEAFKVVSAKYPKLTSNTVATTSSISIFPDELEHLIVLGASSRGLQYLMARVKDNLSGLAPSFVAPSFPSISTLSLSVAPNAPSLSSQSVSSLGTAPAYTKPSFVAPVFPTISTLSLSTAPISPSLSSQSVASLGTAPSYTKPSFVVPSFPSLQTLSPSNAPSAPALKPLSYSDASKTDFGGNVAVSALGTAPSYVSPVSSIDTSQLETFLETNEDPELAGVQIERMRVELGKFQADISDRLNDFNDGAEEYRADIQKKIKQADIDISEAQVNAQNGTNVDIQNKAKQLEADLSDNKLTLEKYASELGSYQTTVNSEVQTFVNNEIQHKFQKWVTEYANVLQGYQLDIQNELNSFNKDNVVYQAELQKKIKDSELGDGDENRLLQKYANEIQSFGATINSEIETWVKNEIDNKFQKWVTDYGNKLQEFQLDIQNELNEFNKENVAYQADLQKKIKDADLGDSGENQALQKYANQIQSFGATINAEVETWSKNEIENKFNKWLNEYANLVQVYNVDVAKYNANLQRYGAEYNWYQEQYQRLDGKYNEMLKAYISN